MADTTYANSADLRVAKELAAEVLFLLHDTADLKGLMFEVPFSGNGSSTIKTPQVQPVYSMAAPGEMTGVAGTDFTDASFDLTVAKYNLQHDISDLFQITAPEGGVDIAKAAEMAVQSIRNNWNVLLTALFPSITANVTTTGVDLTVDGIYDCMYTLQLANVPSPYHCVLYTQQWNDFQDSLRGETGAQQFQPATAEALAAKGPGYKGTWNGIEFYVSDTVTAVGGGADSCGCMFGMGAFARTEADLGKVAPFMAGFPLDGLSAYIEILRPSDANGGMGATRMVIHVYPAVAIAENARAVKIVTDR